MIKILHYAPGFISGGIESRLLDWYRNINREKVQFVLLKLNTIDDTENMREFKSLGGISYNLPSFNMKHVVGFGSKIKKILVKEKIDIVHVHDINSGLFVLREAKKLGIRCRILHARTTDFLPNEKNLLIKKVIKRCTPKYANVFFACSKEAGNWGCGKKHKDDVIVINNGIQTQYFRFNPKARYDLRKSLGIEDKTVIGFAGRISHQKNLPFLMDIFQKLSATSDEYVLLLVGEGNRDILTDYCENHDISGEIILVGEKKNVWDYYMCMDVFCGTSHYEGFGTTAVEAQATGLPVLLSTGFPDVTKLTDFVKRLNTNASDIDEWIKWIEYYKHKRFPEHGMNAVIQSGYSAEKVAGYLLDFYTRNCD